MVKKCVYAEPMIPITSRIPKEAFEEIRKAAKAEGKTISGFLCGVIIEAINWKPRGG